MCWGQLRGEAALYYQRKNQESLLWGGRGGPKKDLGTRKLSRKMKKRPGHQQKNIYQKDEHSNSSYAGESPGLRRGVVAFLSYSTTATILKWVGSPLRISPLLGRHSLTKGGIRNGGQSSRKSGERNRCIRAIQSKPKDLPLGRLQRD